MSTLRVNTLQNAAGTGQPAMVGAAKAWVNFNGTGTVAIRAQFNVSSITDNGTGDYTVNFTTAMPDANYMAATGPVAIGSGAGALELNDYNATSISVITRYAPGGAYDWATVFIAIFR